MKAILSLSGGIDSSTVLGWLIHAGMGVEAVSFSYGSKHNSYEREAAIRVAQWYHIPLHSVDLSAAMNGFRSSLMKEGESVPEGHYSEASMASTVVPSRNIIFLSIASGLAWSCDAQYIALGIHQGDHAIYTDCRVEFFKAMDSAIYLGTDRRVQILAPFLNEDKAGIIRWGMEHAVPYHLTRTCYKDQQEPCGKCGSCVERLEAFEKNGIKDPVKYARK